jgi:hypothetical protein
MEKLYRLVGAAGMCFEAFGVTVGVRVNKPRILGMLDDRFPPGFRQQKVQNVKRLYSLYVDQAERRRGVRRFHSVYSDTQVLLRSENETDLYEAFERDVDSFIAETSTTRFFVHAGVVGWKGRAIVIPGRSYSGKSTLVAEFLRAGATYYSDEFAVFDRKGHVHPFSRPLGIRVEGAEQRQTRKTADEFGSKAGNTPLPVGLVIVTEYRKLTAWRPRPISPGRGVLKLLANAFSTRVSPARALRILTKAGEGAHILVGGRGEAREVVNSVQQKFASCFPLISRG